RHQKIARHWWREMTYYRHWREIHAHTERIVSWVTRTLRSAPSPRPTRPRSSASSAAVSSGARCRSPAHPAELHARRSAGYFCRVEQTARKPERRPIVSDEVDAGAEGRALQPVIAFYSAREAYGAFANFAPSPFE